MKRKTKLLTFASISLAAISLMTGCRPPEKTAPNGEKIDKSKTQIKVGTFDGGFGTDWLYEAKERFETKCADVSFEEGKTGVQITIYGNKTDYTGTNLSGKTLDKDIYFTEVVDYTTFVNNDQLADITDIVKEDLGAITDGAETGRTIEDKLDSTFLDYLTIYEDKYYALPFYDGVYGILCDVDYFSKNEWLFDDEGEFCDEDYAGVGLDGIAGTFDDGLPKNLNQWQTLCGKIKDAGVIPFAYYGAASQSSYVNEACKSIWTTVEGKEKFATSLSFDGDLDLVKTDTINIGSTYDSINEVTYTNATYETELVEITDENLHEVQRTPGKLEMYRFIDEVITEAGNWKENQSDFLDMQERFIYTPEYANASEDKYAMVFEGCWFQNEAKSVFQRLKGSGRRGANERRFVFMPVPTQAGIQDQVIMSANESFAFVNKRAENLEAAKAFFQFLHTDNEMQLFTKSTATSRALNYSIPQEWLDGDELSYFTKSMIYLKNNSDFVYPYSSNPIVINNPGEFDFRHKWPYTSIIDGGETSSPFVYFRDNPLVDAKEYFKGTLRYYSDSWRLGLNK